jgi:hypothetical protein
MYLTSEQMNQLMRDAVLGRESPSIEGEVARAFFDEIKAELAEKKARGEDYTVDMLPD